MYIARNNQVFYVNPVHETEELFVTVHITRDCTMTVEEQAGKLADMMNEWGVRDV